MSITILQRIFYLSRYNAQESDLAPVLNQVFKDYALAKVKKFLRLSHLYLCAYLSILESSATIFTLKNVYEYTHNMYQNAVSVIFKSPRSHIQLAKAS